MTDTLTPPRQPSINSTSKQSTFRTLSASYGDGYIQDTADGANPVVRKWPLSWDTLTSDEAETLETFLESHVGTAFYYVLPREIAPRTVICSGFQRVYKDGVLDGFTATFEERYL